MSKIFSERRKDVVFSEHATIWLTMRSLDQNFACNQFRSDQTSMLTFIFGQTFNTFFYLIVRIISLVGFPSSVTLGALIYSICIPIVLGWINVILHSLKYFNKSSFYSSQRYNKMLICLDSLLMVGTSIAFCLSLFIVGYIGRCGDDVKGINKWGCGTNQPHQMPLDIMMSSMVLPLILTVTIKGATWESTFLSFLIICGCNLFVMFHYDFTDSLAAFCIYAPLCLLVLYENRRQTVSLFLLSQNQENLLLENERLADETHANELRSMIGNVAHDLKTPLSAYMSGMDVILSVVEEARKTPVTDIEKRRSNQQAVLDAIHNMKNVSEFMLMTINRCLDYTKASQGLKLVPRMETISLIEAIELPLKCIKDLQQDSKIRVELKPIDTEIAEHIITDKGWLQENILCLLSNAVKYSNDGVVSLSARLENNKSEETMIRIEVEDSGIGISEDMMDNLFNPFKQAQRLAGGTGLGLYSLSKRIEALGGRYGVQGRHEGEIGSLFWFAVPYRADNTRQSAKELRSSPTTIPSFLSPRSVKTAELNILIVDDSLSILKMSTMMLKRQGHTITTAENGAVAVDKVTAAVAEGVPYDVVLMDLQMPVMDGLEATRRVRELERASTSEKTFVIGSKNSVSRQLIIGVSANSDNETMEAAFAAGIDAFIPKPFTMQSFKETYSSLMTV